jgi:hypothetical protein
MSEITQTEAYRKGVADAEARLALQPEPDHTVSVSIEGRTAWDDRTFYKLCQLCGWPRKSESCPHDQLGEVQLVETRSEFETDPDDLSAAGVDAS